MKIINFDHNATTAVASEVLACINEAYGFSGNSSSSHAMGRKAAMLIETAREDLRDALNAANYEIYFTSGGTEANNMALFGDDYSQIFYSRIEHSSVYNTRPRGVEIVELKADEDGVVSMKDLSEKLAKATSKNFLVSLMLANNETGALQKVREAAQIVHQHGGLIHTDLVQAFGKIPVDLEELNVDFASVSSHKINGPQGAGALLVRRGIDIRPLIYGGGHERGKRAGTLNNAGIAGFGAAIKLLNKKLASMAACQQLRDFLEVEIKKIAGDDVMIFSQNVARASNTSFFALKGADSQTQMIYFDMNGIMVSNGSACSSGTVKTSRVLQAMNVPLEFLGATRVSFGAENTREEVEKFIKLWGDFYRQQKNS